MKRFYKKFVNRLSFVMMFLMLQIVLFLWLVYFVTAYWRWNVIFLVLSIVIVFFLLVKEENPYYRMRWIIPILIFPVFGGAFYILYRRRNIKKKDLNRHLTIERNRRYYLKEYTDLLNNRDSKYLVNFGWMSYQETQSTFLPSGEAIFERMLDDFKAAQSFIFLEFFIIRRGEMLNRLIEVLKEKAEEGVEIIIIYDDFGSSSLGNKFIRQMKKVGIKAHIFNPIKLRLNFRGNYRDHRKIVVVDGKTGYAVASNISDEYINIDSPLGHWCDTGIRLEGRAVWSLTLAFLDVLSFVSKENVAYEKYNANHSKPNDGTVIPFADTPLDKEEVTKNLYLSLIASAKKSIKITTPYLIIDPEFKNMLRLAAKSGIDVSIIIPKCPDKKTVYMVTESHLPLLMKDGVKAYRYTPGFMHAKMMIIDDDKAMIGSANLDYRSLFLHFENSVYLYKSQSIHAMRQFFDETVEQCEQIDPEERPPLYYRFLQMFFRMFAGMM